jgi:hypothetical protein
MVADGRKALSGAFGCEKRDVRPQQSTGNSSFLRAARCMDNRDHGLALWDYHFSG